MSIIGISGHISSGKDTVGKIIQYLIYYNSIQINKNSRNVPYYPTDVFLDELSKNPNLDLSKESTWEIKRFAGKVKEICSILTGIPVEDFEKQEVKNRVLGEEWIRYGYADGFSHVYHDGEKETIMNHKNCDKERYELELKTNWQTAYKHQYTVRELLQRVGTDAMRKVIHPNVWVNALFSEYKQQHPLLSEAKNGWDGVHCICCGKQTEDFTWFICKHCLTTANYPNWIITDVRFPNEANKIKELGGLLIRVNRNPEIWLPIKGFEDEALISNLGRVKTLPRSVRSGTGLRPIPGKILSCNIQDGEYPVVMLSDRRTHLVHLLVANAFIPNDDKTKTQINHKDGIKSNCKVTNLEWCTASYNIQHGYDNKLQYAPKGEQHYNTKITDKVKKEIWYKRNIDNISLADLSIEYNTHTSNICKIAKNNKFSNYTQPTVVTTPVTIDKPYEHPSETALDNYKFDYTIDNNGTIEELIEKVEQILIQEGII